MVYVNPTSVEVTKPNKSDFIYQFSERYSTSQVFRSHMLGAIKDHLKDKDSECIKVHTNSLRYFGGLY